MCESIGTGGKPSARSELVLELIGYENAIEY